MKTKILALLAVIITLSNCAIYPKVSKYMKNNISLGMPKEQVLKKMGTPMRIDSESMNKECLFYKEIVRVGVHDFIVTTALTFENGILTEVKQDDKFINTTRAVLDSTK